MMMKPEFLTYRLIRQRGSVAIESVCLMPVIIILLFAVIHYSMIFFAANLFDYAAKESIRQSIAYVDEACYFDYASSDCSDTQVLNNVSGVIRDNAIGVIQGVTHGKGASLGSLFGVTLPDSLITISAIESGGCCEVTISLPNYQETPFLPTGMIDGLLPGDGSVFPTEITASAVLKLN